MQGPTDTLEALAIRVRERNQITAKIAKFIGRPAHPGHVGEFIAAQIFGLELESSATAKGIDGKFKGGALAGRSVNVKFYPRNSGLLDINPEALPDYFLVLAGPWTEAATSRGAAAPWVITNVYLFEAADLIPKLRAKLGIATSVRRRFWHAAEIFPESKREDIQLTLEQRNCSACLRRSSS